MKKIHILGGGTFSHVRNHLSLAAPAFGQTALSLYKTLKETADASKYEVCIHLTKMADPNSQLVTNDDVAALVDQLIADPSTRGIIFNVAMCDFDGQIGELPSGKHAERLHSRDLQGRAIKLTPADKVIGRIRASRKDIFLVGFKTTCGESEGAQYAAGLSLLKANSCNLVLANDTKTRLNMVIVPEEARYGVTKDRAAALSELADIFLKRLELRFTRSTVVEGDSVPWTEDTVPAALKRVVDHCIKRGAYKPFRGVTAGHFAYKQDDITFITSKRKTNFNQLPSVGLVKVVSTGPDNVIAYGARPSVGGQSQRIVFAEHPEADCIVHFHCPTKPNTTVPVRSQREYECGSHECGANTSAGLQELETGIKAVFLDQHGPNIVFSRNTDPERVIAFIERNFDLDSKTGGMV